MPTAGRARSEQELKLALAEALADARRRTLDLVAPLARRSRRPALDDHVPAGPDLAHIGYFEELWLSRHVGRDEPLLAEGDSLDDAFQNERSARAELPLLELVAAIAYLARVRERALGVLIGAELDPDDCWLVDARCYGLGAPAQAPAPGDHAADDRAPDGGPAVPEAAAHGTPARAGRRRRRGAGRGRGLGAAGDEWALRQRTSGPRSSWRLSGSRLEPGDRGAYNDFVEAGGYEEPRHWTAEGWGVAHRGRP